MHSLYKTKSLDSSVYTATRAHIVHFHFFHEICSSQSQYSSGKYNIFPSTLKADDFFASRVIVALLHEGRG
jgi:hypothetical protein